MSEELDKIEILDVDRIAATKFIEEEMARRFKLAQSSFDLENSLRDEARQLSEYILQSDTRTSCILAASFLEDSIRRNFADKWSITPKLEDQFFGSNGPLSTFHQRVTVAQGLGWVPKKPAADISTLRKIRNELAHNHRVHRLDEDPLRSWADSITAVERSWDIEGAVNYQRAYAAAPRELRLQMRVVACAFMCVSVLVARSNLIKFELSPSHRGGNGYEGLTQIEKDFIEIVAEYCFSALGIEESGLG